MFTMYAGRLNLTLQVVDQVKKFFGDKVYKTTVPRNVRLSEAPVTGSPSITTTRPAKAAKPIGPWRRNC